MPSRGLLTEKQFMVLSLRSKGLTQAEVAKILGMSRPAVAIAEKRALEKVRLARETLRAYAEATAAAVVEIKAGTRLVDVPGIVMSEADRAGVKLRANFEYIYGLLRYKAEAGYPRLKRDVKIYIMRDGRVEVEPAS